MWASFIIHEFEKVGVIYLITIHCIQRNFKLTLHLDQGFSKATSRDLCSRLRRPQGYNC